MRSFVLQDWVTIRGASGVSSITQAESNWLALDSYQDVIFWLQVAELTTGGATVTLNYETAPIKDESLFSVLGTSAGPSGAIGLSAASMTPKIVNFILSGMSTSGGVPLSRWVRWHLITNAAGTGWDVTFRILVNGNQLWLPSTGGTWGQAGYGAGWGPGR